MVGMRDGLTRQDRGASRFNYKAPDGRVILLQGSGAARKGTARAGKIAKSVHAAGGLANNLWSGVQIVSARIAREVELIRSKRLALSNETLRFALDEFQIAAGDLAGRGVGQLIDQDNFCAEGFHHARAFDGIAFGHHRDEGIALDAANNGQAGAGVAAGQLDNRLTGLERSSGFCLFDHL